MAKDNNQEVEIKRCLHCSQILKPSDFKKQPRYDGISHNWRLHYSCLAKINQIANYNLSAPRIDKALQFEIRRNY